MTDALDHFIRLARRGKHPAASGGEKRAHAIAACLVKQGPGLDTDAIEGLAEYARLVNHDYLAAKELLDRKQEATR